MPRYVVTTRRALRETTVFARDAVLTHPGVKLLAGDDPHVVTIEADEPVADQLRAKLRDTHIVEPEIRRSLN